MSSVAKSDLFPSFSPCFPRGGLVDRTVLAVVVTGAAVEADKGAAVTLMFCVAAVVLGVAVATEFWQTPLANDGLGGEVGEVASFVINTPE